MATGEIESLLSDGLHLREETSKEQENLQHGECGKSKIAQSVRRQKVAQFAWCPVQEGRTGQEIRQEGIERRISQGLIRQAGSKALVGSVCGRTLWKACESTNFWAPPPELLNQGSWGGS